MTKIPKTKLCEIVNPSTFVTPAKARVHKHLKRLDSGFPDCVAIVITLHIHHFVIPDLTRNPVLFQRFTLLDAGSSPA
jgi:hypothetical protein